MKTFSQYMEEMGSSIGVLSGRAQSDEQIQNRAQQIIQRSDPNTLRMAMEDLQQALQLGVMDPDLYRAKYDGWKKGDMQLLWQMLQGGEGVI